MAPSFFPIEYCIAALFIITLFFLFPIGIRQTEIVTQEEALLREIEVLRYQADIYFDAEDWNGYYGAISKSQEATIKLIEFFEREGA